MTATRVRGELGPACANCQTQKVWCGTRWLCRPCQAEANRERRARLTDEQREADRVRANQLRNARRALWTEERRELEYGRIRQWREANREAYLQGARDWYWRDPASARAAKLEEYRANPQSFIARNLKRKARLREAICEHGDRCVDAEFLAEVYAKPCHYCGDPATDADHFMPISGGGLHCRENLVPACGPCNGSKYNHDPIEWMRSRAG